ncbi:MAG: SRPBCC domain-containing protein [Immundisolibacterales bacterium]|nr:SRPBCC domain-containing protein [Immundisolibacterales bacterium]
MSELPIYVLEREFAAPRELVWRAWTDPVLLPRWYGPGAETVVHRLDLEPGGLWLLEMRWGGNSHYQRVEYVEVEPPGRLVWLHSVADADWSVVANPMMADWPRVLRTAVTFEEADGRTKMRFTWVPENANGAEVACFAAAMGGMDKGWSTGMEKIAELLVELEAGPNA